MTIHKRSLFLTAIILLLGLFSAALNPQEISAQAKDGKYIIGTDVTFAPSNTKILTETTLESIWIF